VFNYLGGSLARVFTTLAEVNDPVILAGYVGGVVLNAVLALQMVMFWNASPAKTKTGKKFYAKQGQKGKKRA
jgi:mannose-P-dolichol utilization defect protein 1